MLGKQRPFLCSHVSRPGLGSRLESQSASQVDCDWMNWSWLTARQASALLGKGHAFPGESGPVSCLGCPLTTTLLVPPQAQHFLSVL